MSERPRRPTFCGYLHVKRPADQRYALIRPLSSWKSRLVTVLLDVETREDNERTNVVKILLGKKQAALASRNAQTGAGNNVQKKISRASRNLVLLKSNNCVIYRCRWASCECGFSALSDLVFCILYKWFCSDDLCKRKNAELLTRWLIMSLFATLEQVAQGSACFRTRQPNAPSPLPGSKQRDTLSTLDEEYQVDSNF